MSTKPAITKLYHESLPCSAYVIGLREKNTKSWKTFTVQSDKLKDAFPYNFFKSKYEYHIKPLEAINSHHYTFLDDVSQENINRMKLDGLIPAMVIETSPNKFQLWLRFEKTMSYEQALATSRYLTRKYEADKGAISTSHFSRCPYFKRILKNGAVFEAKLVENSRIINHNLEDEIIQPQKEENYKETLRRTYTKAPNIKSPLSSDIDAKCKTYISNLVNKGYEDMSMVDFITIAWLYRDGYSQGSIISAMMNNSLNLIKRKGNFHNAQRYLNYTFANVEKKIVCEKSMSPQ